MKKILIGLGVIILVVALGLVLLPFVISADMLKAKATAAVQAATGRTLAINGPVSLSVFPNIRLELQDVTFSNAPWAAQKNMAALKSMALGLKLLPLLHGDIAVTSFHLDQPVIDLEISKTGEANWVMGKETPPSDQPLGQQMAAMFQHFSLQDVRISHGEIGYADARSGSRYRIGDANLALDMQGLDDPLKLSGDVMYNNQKVTFDAKLDRLGDLLTGPGTRADLKIDAEPLHLGFSGTAGGAAMLAGDTSFSSPAIGALSQWLSPKAGMKPGQFKDFSIKGKLTAKKNDYDFADATLAFDAIKATGAFNANTAGDKPVLKGRLAIDRLDANPYLPAPAAAAPANAGPPPDWSDAPIDSSALDAFDLDFDLALGALQLRDIRIGKSALHLTLAGGTLTANLGQMALYGGSGRAKLVAHGRSGGIGVSGDMAFNVPQVGELLKDAIKFTRIDGAGVINASLAADGRSQRALISSLGGHGDLRFTNGKIIGFNLAGAVRKATSLGFDPSAVTDRSTDFSELSATFQIAQGKLTNNDFKLLGPLVRATGAGAVDLPPRKIDYRIDPKLVASLAGQGGAADLAGLEIPVRITGDLWAPKIGPDLAAIAKNPGAVIQGGKSIVDQFKKGGGSGGGGLGGALKGLFGQ